MRARRSQFIHASHSPCGCRRSIEGRPPPRPQGSRRIPIPAPASSRERRLRDTGHRGRDEAWRRLTPPSARRSRPRSAGRPPRPGSRALGPNTSIQAEEQHTREPAPRPAPRATISGRALQPRRGARQKPEQERRRARSRREAKAQAGHHGADRRKSTRPSPKSRTIEAPPAGRRRAGVEVADDEARARYPRSAARAPAHTGRAGSA